MPPPTDIRITTTHTRPHTHTHRPAQKHTTPGSNHAARRHTHSSTHAHAHTHRADTGIYRTFAIASKHQRNREHDTHRGLLVQVHSLVRRSFETKRITTRGEVQA